MRKLYPVPLSFYSKFSVEVTWVALCLYGIKPPSLKADFVETLLKTMDVKKELQESLLRDGILQQNDQTRT